MPWKWEAQMGTGCAPAKEILECMKLRICSTSGKSDEKASK